MISIRIAQFSDLHYCPEHLAEVDRCFEHAIDDAIDRRCEAAVISGDLWDHRVHLSHPAVAALLARVSTLAEAMPVLILQGTFSHDVPGALDVFETLAGEHPIHVAHRTQRVALFQSRADGQFAWQTVPGAATELPVEHHIDIRAVFSCLPSFNKAELADAVAAGEHCFQTLKSWAPLHLAERAARIPTVVVSHGTVSGSHTEHGVPMHGMDHQFTEGALFAAEASAVMLGHIHAHQAWSRDERRIAYPGSIGRLHYGEQGGKGWCYWEVDHQCASLLLRLTPATELVDVTFEGEPAQEELSAAARDIRSAMRTFPDNVPLRVRVRYVVDEERAGLIDRKGIEHMFLNAGAAACKVEAIVNPVTRARSSGITQHVTTAEKLAVYCESTGLEASALLDRLHLLETAPSVEAIVDRAEPAQEEAA